MKTIVNLFSERWNRAKILALYKYRKAESLKREKPIAYMESRYGNISLYWCVWRSARSSSQNPEIDLATIYYWGERDEYREKEENAE